MGRIIEILKEFQNSSQTLFLPYLVAKFSLNIRTLQKDIQRINTLLSKISNCKIIKDKEQLIVIGSNPKESINQLLVQLSQSSKNDLLEINQLLWHFIWETNYSSNKKLIKLTNNDWYSLNLKLKLINNFFQYYQLKLSLRFKNKKGWILSGCEKDLRILAIDILINHPPYPNSLDFKYFNFYSKLDEILLNNNFYNYYFHEIIYFLIILIKRIKINKILNNYHSYFLNKKNIIENHCNQLINILEKNFSFKFDKNDLSYLQDVMLFNQRKFNDNLFFTLKIFINDLIFSKYQLSFEIEQFKSYLNNFLQENYLKFLFNFYQNFNFNKVKFNMTRSFLLLNDSYYYGWEILSIIHFALKNFDININFDLFIDDYFLTYFNNLNVRDNQKNWIIPLYYQNVSNSYYEFHKINKIILFIKNKYPNIILNPLSMNNDIYKFNFLNQNYSLLIHNSVALNISYFKKIFLIENNQVSNQQLEKNIDLAVKMLILNKVYASIFIIDFFSKQKFYSLKSFLNFLQDFLIRKFKINWITFELKEAFIQQKFLEKNILLIHRMVPINNIEFPIILIYLRNPLFFSKKNPVHFIFILITIENTLFQYHWIILYLQIIKDNLDIKVKTVKKLYKVLGSFYI